MRILKHELGMSVLLPCRQHRQLFRRLLHVCTCTVICAGAACSPLTPASRYRCNPAA